MRTGLRPTILRRKVDATYDDPVGDPTGSGADIRRVAVVNDSSVVGVGVFYANRSCATSSDYVFVYLDVDQNGATGDAGAEYALFFDGGTNTRGVYQWNGTTYTELSVAYLQAGCNSAGYDYWFVTRAELAITSGFNFGATSNYVDGAGALQTADFAPDITLPDWNYQLSSAPPPPPTTTTTTTPPPSPPPPPPPPSKAYSDASSLPSMIRYTGRSIKHVRLGERMYETMKMIGLRPQLVAIACWSAPDWPSVLASVGDKPTRDNISTEGFHVWTQPHWIHLAPKQCSNIQGLMDDRQPNGQRAYALATALHERVHAEGVRNEARTNCYAVQLIEVFARHLGFVPTKAHYLAQLGLRKTRAAAPPGYWNRSRCRDGGQWDLVPDSPNLGS